MRIYKHYIILTKIIIIITITYIKQNNLTIITAEDKTIAASMTLNVHQYNKYIQIIQTIIINNQYYHQDMVHHHKCMKVVLIFINLNLII